MLSNLFYLLNLSLEISHVRRRVGSAHVILGKTIYWNSIAAYSAP